MTTRLTKAIIENLLNSCVDLMLDRDKTKEDSIDEMIIEVESMDDLYTVFGYFLSTYGHNISTGDMGLMETWEFAEGKTTTVQFRLYGDFWVSIGYSDHEDNSLCELLGDCFILDLRGFETAEVV